MKKAIRAIPLLVLVSILSACGSEEGKALCAAIDVGDLPAVEALIAQGADVNETVSFNGDLTKPMLLAMSWAVSLGGVRDEIAIAVIEGGGNPNAHFAWSSGRYVLPVVAQGGRTAVVQALVDAGAEVEVREQGGEAAVWAARRNHVDVLRILADAGADLDYKDELGDTPLGAAVEEGAREAIEFLEERGASEW